MQDSFRIEAIKENIQNEKRQQEILKKKALDAKDLAIHLAKLQRETERTELTRVQRYVAYGVNS